MADVTLLRRLKMICAFTGGGLPVVATAAITGDTLMVECSTDERRRSVTVGTIQRGWNVIRRLAGRGRIVVARRAAIDDARVIERCIHERLGVMANAAVLVGLRMGS